jgi:hypothetical protein
MILDFLIADREAVIGEYVFSWCVLVKVS